MSAEELWQRLSQANVVQGQMPSAAHEPEAPWYVRAMLGIAGWIAAIMLLATSVALFEVLFESSIMSATFGFFLCIVAFVVYRSEGSGNFARQFAFAFSLTGQAFLIFGLSTFFGFTLSMGAGLYGLIPVALVTIALMVLLFLLIPEYLHRIWCATLAVIATGFMLLVYSGSPYVLPLLLGAAALLWLQELRWLRWGNALRALAYALVFGGWLYLLLQANMFTGTRSLLSHLDLPSALSGAHWVIGNTLLLLVLLAVVVVILRRYALALHSPLSLASLALCALVGVFAIAMNAPGILAGLILVLLGFAQGVSTLTGSGFAALLAFVGHFYYQLHLSLLQKSLLLVLIGVSLLALRAVFIRYWGAAGDDQHA